MVAVDHRQWGSGGHGGMDMDMGQWAVGSGQWGSGGHGPQPAPGTAMDHDDHDVQPQTSHTAAHEFQDSSIPPRWSSQAWDTVVAANLNVALGGRGGGTGGACAVCG